MIRRDDGSGQDAENTKPRSRLDSLDHAESWTATRELPGTTGRLRMTCDSGPEGRHINSKRIVDRIQLVLLSKVEVADVCSLAIFNRKDVSTLRPF
jgi:hypothetical protein